MIKGKFVLSEDCFINLFFIVGVKFNKSVTSLTNTFNDTGIYETIEPNRLDPDLDLDDGSKPIPGAPPLSASRLQLLQDTTMIESALDLDSLEDTSSVGTGSQVKLVKNKNTLWLLQVEENKLYLVFFSYYP